MVQRVIQLPDDLGQPLNTVCIFSAIELEKLSRRVSLIYQRKPGKQSFVITFTPRLPCILISGCSSHLYDQYYGTGPVYGKYG